MKSKYIKKITLCLIFLFALILIGIAGINIYMLSYSKPYIYKNISALPEKYVVIVPGAKVYKNTVSHVVRDRIEAAVNCLKNKKAERVLISGDHGRKGYDEVNRMRIFMQDIYGTDENLIFMDHAGFSTYETMYRAREIFCVEDAVVVTQAFHTARAVYIGRKLGLDVIAYEAPEVLRYSRETRISWEIREALARVKTFFLVMFNVKPTFLGKKIPITGNAKDTWDF